MTDLSVQASHEPSTFTLSEQQVDALQVHHSQLFHAIFNWLDDEFRLVPPGSANWPMLGQHFIELLHIIGPQVYADLCTDMVRTALGQEPAENPFVVASMAEAGFIDIDLFKKVLQDLLSKRHSSGLNYFASGYLRLGDHFSTLWALRLLALARKAEEEKQFVEAAVSALARDFEEVLTKSSLFVAFFLYDLRMLGRGEDDELVKRCLIHLFEGDTAWQKETNLLEGGFITYDLLTAVDLRPGVLPAVEDWLARAFSLTEEVPTRLPEPFATAQESLNTDVWAQGWLRSLITASLYLRMRRPFHHPAQFQMTQLVHLKNEAAQLRSFVEKIRVYLPSFEAMQSLAPQLQEFWKLVPYEKSVFIMRWMGENDAMQKVTDAICHEVAAAGLVPRRAEERLYDLNLLKNNEIYLRGCKYGIVVFERLLRKGKIPFGPNDNVLVEMGFMLGKAAPKLLVLYDQDSMDAPVQGEIKPPGGTDLPSVIQGIIRKDFESEQIGLHRLRREVAVWAAEIAALEAGAQPAP